MADSNIYIKRIALNPEETIGEIRFGHSDGNPDGYTLEPPGPSTTAVNLNQRIPPGIYNVTNHITGAKGGHGYPRLYGNGVSHNRAILIHPGNNKNDTVGCILPGYTRGNADVGNSLNFWLHKVKVWLETHGYNNVRVIITGG
jgi:hypothetical protein